MELDTPYELLVRVTRVGIERQLDDPDVVTFDAVPIKVLCAGWPLPRLPQKGDEPKAEVRLDWMDFHISDAVLGERLKVGQYLRVRIEAEPNGEQLAQPYVDDAGSLPF